MTTKLSGELEIDHDRGVIYFHVNSKEQADKLGGITALRICRLGKIPKGVALDITHMHGVNWVQEGLGI